MRKPWLMWRERINIRREPHVAALSTNRLCNRRSYRTSCVCVGPSAIRCESSSRYRSLPYTRRRSVPSPNRFHIAPGSFRTPQESSFGSVEGGYGVILATQVLNVIPRFGDSQETSASATTWAEPTCDCHRPDPSRSITTAVGFMAFPHEEDGVIEMRTAQHQRRTAAAISR